MKKVVLGALLRLLYCALLAFILHIGGIAAITLRPRTVPFWNYVFFVYGVIVIMVIIGSVYIDRLVRYEVEYLVK